MSSTAAGGGSKSKQSRSASAIIADTASGYHILKIDGYSCTKETPIGECLKSRPFTAGGHRWCIRYYPNGSSLESAGYISLLLHLDESATSAVKAQCDLRFVWDVVNKPLKLQRLARFGPSGDQNCWGYSKFITRENLERSGHLKDDSFSVRCDIVVINAYRAEDMDMAVAEAGATAPAFVSVPPPNLHQHLGDLLESEKGADVVFDVGGQTFAAHRCVLAARSPVFSAELFGTMKESDAGCVVRIDDMEAQAFKALLNFIYTDMLPEVETEDQEQGEEDDVISPGFIFTDMLPDRTKEEQEEEVMAQHLLVAADRYNLERLKLICEEKLCKYIDVGTVVTIFMLAEQHHCHGLKKACFDFLSSPANLRAVVANDGFDHLNTFIMKELIAMLGNLVK